MKECITTKRFDHPNVLGLIGVSVIQKEAIPLMILPYMHNGDVRSFVISKRKSKNPLEMTDFPVVKNLVHMRIHFILCKYYRI